MLFAHSSHLRRFDSIEDRDEGGPGDHGGKGDAPCLPSPLFLVSLLVAISFLFGHAYGQGTVGACGFATLNINGWMDINALVVILSITIGGFVFAVANFLPAERREKLRGIAKYEMIEAVISIVIVLALIVIASASCQIGGLLFGQTDYNGVFTSIGGYLGNLLFVNGINLVTRLYATSIQFAFIAKFAFFLLNQATDLIQGFLGGGGGVSFLGASVTFSSSIDALFSAYSGVFTSMYGGLLAASFGGLFVLWLLIPIIQAGAMTVVAPLSIVFRSLSFEGPQLRRTANLFLAMAVGFYFVLPLTIAMDSYIANCLNIQGLVGIPQSAVACPPSEYPFFQQYFSGYNIAEVPIALFNAQGSPADPSIANIPAWASSYPGLLTNSFYNTLFNSNNNLNEWLQAMFLAPSLAEEYGRMVAAYLFLSIVLLAVDMGVTLGFIAGLARGLDSMSNLFGVGGFWQ